MAKLAFLIHIILMTVVMGAFVIAILAVPALGEQAMKLIPIAAGVGFLAAIPASVIISRRILQQTRGI